MSVFDNVTEWPDRYKACGAPHQSPVNLSRTFALPCDRLCEWKVDEVAVQEASIENTISTNGGLMLHNFSTGTPTAKFNGEGYTCREIVLYSSSQHSIENIFGEAELVATFTNPKGYIICMSVLIRSTPGDTPSSRFLNAFVPFVDSNQRITLGSSWMLTDLLPETPAYYVYEGTTIQPNCTPDVTWIVYSNMVNMDPSDYAKLASRIPQKRRPLQEVADRQVYFNDAEGTVNPAYAKKDGKIYMRCRKIVKDKKEDLETKDTVRKSNLLSTQSMLDSEESRRLAGNARYSLQEQYEKIGGFWGIVLLLFVIGISYYLFFSTSGQIAVESFFRYILFVPILLRTFIVKMLYSS